MTEKLKTTSPAIPGLPDPGDYIDSSEEVMFQTANDAVESKQSVQTAALQQKKEENGENIINLMNKQWLKLSDKQLKTGLHGQRGFTAHTGMKDTETNIRRIRNQHVRIRKVSGM